MKYYTISTKPRYAINDNGDVVGIISPSKVSFIVEKEEIAKHFCRNNLGYEYKEIEVKEDDTHN